MCAKSDASSYFGPCPFLLETGIQDWGPPFRFEILWLLEKGFIDYVKEWWSSISLSGWMGYQLTQKLKFLKKKMKCRRKDVFSSLLERKSCLLSDIQSFDGKEEVGLLSSEDHVHKSLFQEDFRRLIFQEELKWETMV